MKVYDAASIRNVALVGHSGSGKTQLVSAMLFDAGMVNRFGKVDEGTTVTDYDEEEIARKHTLSASLAYAEWNKTQNQPHRHAGHRQLPRATRAPRCSVADAALVVVDAVAGVEVQTEKVWAAADELGAAAARRRSTGSIASAPASSARSQSLRAVVQPHGHPDPAADRRREERSRGVVDLVAMKALHVRDRRQRQVHRRRRCPATWPTPSTRRARR